MMKKIGTMALVLALGGCPEAEDDTPDVQVADTSSDMGAIDSGTEDVGEADMNEADMSEADTSEADMVESDVTMGGGIDDIVLNEMDPADEWFEFYNAGSSSVALGGYKVCDADDEGMPRVDRAFAFPADFELGAGEYIIAVEADTPELDVISTECAVGERCLHTDFGLSAGSGDTVFLLDASDAVVKMLVLPADAVVDGQSYCIFPNATGAAMPCTPTPGAANETAI